MSSTTCRHHDASKIRGLRTQWEYTLKRISLEARLIQAFRWTLLFFQDELGVVELVFSYSLRPEETKPVNLLDIWLILKSGELQMEHREKPVLWRNYSVYLLGRGQGTLGIQGKGRQKEYWGEGIPWEAFDKDNSHLDSPLFSLVFCGAHCFWEGSWINLISFRWKNVYHHT